MADYYPLLKRAVSGLADATPAAREAIYERARKALLGQLRAIEPPVAPEDLERESTELDAAIARLEADLAPADGMPAPAETAAIVAEPDIVPPAPAPVTPPASVPGESETVAVASADVLARAMPELPAGPDVAGETAPPTSESNDLRLRPREPQRPLAPVPAAPRGQYRRVIILSVVAAGVVALVATAALKLRNSPDELARLKPVAAPTAETNTSGKIVERIGGEAAAPAAPPVSATAPAGSTGLPAAPPAPPATAVTQAPIPIASRAALLVEAPDLDTKMRTFIGSSVWRLDNVAANAGQPLGAAVHADVDIPDAKVKVSLDIRKNTDPALPASNTIEVRFALAPGSAVPGVAQISVPQMRREDSPNGDVLAGVPVKITDTYFLVGLAQGDIASRNSDLMRNRGWIDIPIQLSDKHIAKLTIEKGTSGERILADALTTWSQ